MNLSVIIVTYNAAEVIVPCLDSLFESIRALPSPAETEVIVADNCSADDTIDRVRAAHPRCRLIQNNANLGFAAAVNGAAEHAAGSVLLLLNPDTIVSPETLGECLQVLERHPSAAGCVPQILNVDGSPQPSAWNFPGIGATALEMFLPYFLSSRVLAKNAEPGQTDPFPVDAVSGAVLMVRREVFRSLGGLDEQFFMYCEDIDFCLRAKKAGYSIYFVPRVMVRHRQGFSAWKRPESMFAWLYSSKLRYFHKHESPRRFGAVFMLIIIGLVYKIVFYGLAGLVLFRRDLRGLARGHAAALPHVLNIGTTLFNRH